MDRHGVDMQVLSLTSPGIQLQPDPDIAVADARNANEFLAGIINEHPTRFAGLAAIPLQDPPRAAVELRHAIEVGLCGALVNDHTLGHFLDEPQYAPFWETLQDLDVPLYIHPNAVSSDTWKVVEGYPALDTAMWSWAPRAGGHAMRLIFGGIFDRYPDARIILGHMGEFLPFQLSRLDSRCGTHRGDPGSRHRQRDVLDRLPLRVHGKSGPVHAHRAAGPRRPGASGIRQR